MPRAYLVRKLKLVIFFCIVFILLYGGNILRRAIRDRKCSEEESKFLMDELVSYIHYTIHILFQIFRRRFNVKVDNKVLYFYIIPTKQTFSSLIKFKNSMRLLCVCFFFLFWIVNWSFSLFFFPYEQYITASHLIIIWMLVRKNII